jgi:hypothetical protein
MNRPQAGAAPAEPPRYELRVRGVLDPRWSGWFDGLQVTSDDRETTIAGPVADQAALHGLLARSATLAWSCSRSAASTQNADHLEAAMQPLPTPTRPPRTQRSPRFRMARRQRRRRSSAPIDRRTPSGRLLAY